jgi:hypothetical protein
MASDTHCGGISYIPAVSIGPGKSSMRARAPKGVFSLSDRRNRLQSFQRFRSFDL